MNNEVDRRHFLGLAGIGMVSAVAGPKTALASEKAPLKKEAVQNRGRRIGTTMFSRYGIPNDRDAFDRYYYGHHVQLAKTNQDVLSIILSDGDPIVKQQGPAKDRNASLHKVAFTTYPTLPAARVSWNTAEGIATGVTIEHYATGGLSLVFYDANEILEQNRVAMGPPLPGINKGRRCGAYVVTLYERPTDPEAFDQHFYGTYLEALGKNPDALSLMVSDGPIGTMPKEEYDGRYTEKTKYHKITATVFPSLEKLQATFEPMSQFASGVTSTIFNGNEVMDFIGGPGRLY